MGKLATIRNSFGIGFVILGIIVSLINHPICRSICLDCSDNQISPCFFLFLFVGTIFIISGASLIIPYNFKKKLKKKSKKRDNYSATTLKLLVTTL